MAKAKRLSELVPDNWCDELLTGPNGLGPQPWHCGHIEKLLRGVKQRIQDAENVRSSSTRNAQK